MKPIEEIVWHYTTGELFRLIVESGELRPATTYVPENERPIVWFSSNKNWEQTANKALRNNDGTVRSLDRDEMAALGGGLVRIGVHPETAPHDWHALKELSRMSSKMAQGLYKSAIRKGSRPGEWRGTFEPVPREKWTAVEVYQNNEWVPVPFLRADEE